MKKFFLFLPVVIVLLSCSNQTRIAEAKKSTEGSNSGIDSTTLLSNLKYLSSDDLEGRETDTKGNKLAQQFILKEYKKTGLSSINNSFEQDFEFSVGEKKIKAKNLWGMIKGKTQPEKYIVVTAHYDHVGIRKGEIYNGTDDNASGVTTMLEIAKWFSKNPPNKSIIFIAFDAEEKGLKGAYHFVKNCPIDKSNILLNINMDMISRNAQNEIYICGTAHYPHLKPKLEHLNKTTSITVKFGHDRPIFGMGDWTSSSDHGAFHKEKIPFLYLGVEDHEDYHKPTDDFEKIKPEFFYSAAKLALEMVSSFDKN